MHYCIRCREDYPDEAFATDRSRTTGLANVCRECNKEKSRDWYRRNADAKIKKSQEYRERFGRGEETPRADRPVRERRRPEPAPEPPKPELRSQVFVVRLTKTQERWVEAHAAQAGKTPQEFVEGRVMRGFGAGDARPAHEWATEETT